VTSNAARAGVLVRALRAGIEGDRDALAGVVTDDVLAWSPAVSAGSLAELVDALVHRDEVLEAFSDVELVATALDVGGDHGCAEWSLALTHSGPLTLGPEAVVAPTGLRVVLHGVTVAEFRGGRICSLRQYWDESSLSDQLGVARP
jgi:hypothetical protein